MLWSGEKKTLFFILLDFVLSDIHESEGQGVIQLQSSLHVKLGKLHLIQLLVNS